MKIKDALYGMPSTKRIKIGAENGTSFFYCGTIEDLLFKIDDYSLICRQNARKEVAEANNRLSRLINNPPTIERFVKRELRKPIPAVSIENYNLYVEMYLKIINRTLNSIDTKKFRLSTFEPLDKREVIEVREADPAVDEDVIILIVSGYEVGSYWTTDECDENTNISFQNDYIDQDTEDDDE